MRQGTQSIGILAAGVASLMAWAALPVQARAHCDTLDGPVVKEARVALEKSDVTPLLKWVQKENEEEVRTAFKNTIAVRALSPVAKQLADRYFLETLVRIHRAGEGAPYTGLKPAGAQEPSVVAADRALEKGSVDGLIAMITRQASEGIRSRFARTLERKIHAGESVEAGREYVKAYVEYIHYVERLASDASHSGAHRSGAEEVEAHHH
jgi:hypothetical protein